MDGARERGEGESKRRRKSATERGRGAWEKRGRKGDREIGREGNFKRGTLRGTLASIQYTAHKTTHNAALVIATLVLRIQNCKRVYKLCIVMRRNVLFDRWMT